MLENRRSPSAARDVLEKLVPKARLISLAKVLAHSVSFAYRASPSKWGLRLNRDNVMLKVGFVEVLQIGDGWFHFLLKSEFVPPSWRSDRRLEFSDRPYRNAPECDACDMQIALAARAYEALREAHEAAIEIAARSPRHTSTTRDHSPGLVVYLSQLLNVALPQPAYLQSMLEHSSTIPEEIPGDAEFREGAAVQILVNRHERDPVARERCIDHYGPKCVACGFLASNQYGSDVSGLIHVHHLEPLARAGKSKVVDPVRDLRPVCPNCHAVIHSTRPQRTIEQVRMMIRNCASSTT